MKSKKLKLYDFLVKKHELKYYWKQFDRPNGNTKENWNVWIAKLNEFCIDLETDIAYNEIDWTS